MSTLSPDPVLDLDACTLAAATRRGDLTCGEVTRLYLSRLETLNPALRAVLTVNPGAQAQADALDEWPEPVRGPLHGVPLLIKDNIDVAGLPTTAGSRRLRGHVPPADAPLVARLRAAGAVVLGKANMTEWANFMALDMPNGYSSCGGQTVNPWGTDLDTGGSSSGSGVAVAARLCVAAIGTETSGSIVSPAHENGVIGLKPTAGRVPQGGIVPISPTQDTAGPLTRTVRDAGLLLAVMTGAPVPRPTSGIDLRALRVGVVDLGPPEDTGRAALETVRAALETLGARVTDVPFPSRAELRSHGSMLEVLEYEFRDALNAYLAGVVRGPRTLADVIADNETDAEQSLRYGQTLLHASQAAQADAPAYARARARDLRLTRVEGFDPLFASGLDVAVFSGIQGYALAAKAGYPSLALPVQVGGPRPAGVLLVGPPDKDEALLASAALLNRQLGGVRFPDC